MVPSGPKDNSGPSHFTSSVFTALYSPPLISGPAYKKVATMSLTRGHSCNVCQQRKVRCDQQKPCANCVRTQVECKVAPPQPARRRRKKLHERDLLERLKKYETLMTQNGVAFDSAFDDQDETIGRQGSSSIKSSHGNSIPSQIPRYQGNGRRSVYYIFVSQH